MAPQINIEIYTREFSPNKSITAKNAKEIFFLTVQDLKYVDHERPSCMVAGSYKLFDIHEIKHLSIRKFGSVQALIEKATALNQRRANKVRRDEEKREEEHRRRVEAAAAAERFRVAEIERKKRERLEKKRQAEQQAQDAASWRELVVGMQGSGMAVNAESLCRILEDVQTWKKRKADMQIQVQPESSVTGLGLGTEVSPPKRVRLEGELADTTVTPDSQVDSHSDSEDSSASIDLNLSYFSNKTK